MKCRWENAEPILLRSKILKIYRGNSDRLVLRRTRLDALETQL